ncbi:MAG: hypothetical protein ACREJ2_03975 [Planctomycetota bacterium]
MAIDPYLPPGAPGTAGDAVERPARPLWESLVLVASGLSLFVFFLSDSLFPAWAKMAVGGAAVALLVVVFARRIRAVRGTLVPPAEAPRSSGPKPYHLPPRRRSEGP